MRVLLVVKSKFMESLGVMYLSAVVKKSGNECRIISLSEAYKTCSDTSWSPDVIGFSIMTGDLDKFKDLHNELTHLKYLYEFRDPPKFIVGGPDPSFFPDGYSWTDEIVRGEGENWINQFLTKNNVATYNNIDDIPWPSRDDFPNMKVRDFITSRGCPYNTCHYCYNEKWMKLFPEYEKVRIRDSKDVVAEIKFVHPEYVYFQDSVFGINMDWMKEFAEEYPQIPYQCHLRPEMVTEERVKLLKKSNCVAVRMALESASDRLREMVGRKMSLNTVCAAAELLKKEGIQIMLQNILSLPESTIEDDLETLEFNIKCKPDYSWSSIYVPYPGTKLGDWCKEKGYYKGNYENITDSFFDKSVLEFSEKHKEQVYCLQKIFAFCVEMKTMPDLKDLTVENLPKLIHKVMRKAGDNKLYAGLL
jgi:radical SAM superfamily enzyme YgiQ (UPF0313 family)